MPQESFIRDFKIKLLNILCEDWDETAMRLIRKHDKLKTGDFSFPNLGNSKVWSRYKLKEVSLSTIPDKYHEVEKCEESRDVVFISLNRKLVIKEQLKSAVKSITWTRERNLKIVNFDELKPNSSELTSARCSSLCNVLRKLPLPTDTAFLVSSTFLTSQVESWRKENSYEGKMRSIQVGAVVGKGDKKETEIGVEEFRGQIFETIKQLDAERRDEDEDVAEVEDRLRVLAASSLQFSLLGTNITQPVKLQVHNQSSSFVLYNLARMKQLVRTFEAAVARGEYPEISEVNTDLLAEDEEWELFFDFLLSYPEVIEECCRTLSLHKLVIFMCSFASTFSKYFSRVKILKDPLPHLIPSVHAKIHFVKILSSLIINCLDVLNVEYVSRM